MISSKVSSEIISVTFPTCMYKKVCTPVGSKFVARSKISLLKSKWSLVFLWCKCREAQPRISVEEKTFFMCAVR